MEIDKNVSTIIWDLDGTMIDSFEVYAALLAQAAQQNDLPVPERKVIVANYHGRLADSISNTLGLSNEQQLNRVVSDFIFAQKTVYDDPEEHLFPDSVRLANRAYASGLRQLVVTNRHHEGAGSASPRAIVGDSCLRSIMSEVVCGDDTPFCKPNPEVVLPKLRNYSVKSGEVVVIGDQHVDAELARNLGARAIIVGRQGVPPHLATLPNWESYVSYTETLDTVTVAA